MNDKLDKLQTFYSVKPGGLPSNKLVEQQAGLLNPEDLEGRIYQKMQQITQNDIRGVSTIEQTATLKQRLQQLKERAGIREDSFNVCDKQSQLTSTLSD